jgi:glyoxylase-like metal-dependent hydrolase (beta-lactamase superfamily II)
MIERIAHGDVVQLRMTSRISRIVGYSASAFLSRGVLIDTGFPKVARELSHVIDTERPAGVFLTHHHEDHAGNAELIAARGIPISASPDTLARLRDFGAIGMYRLLTWGAPVNLVSPVTPFAHDAFELLPTPGHSRDHHVVWDAERETLFAGDLFLGVKVRIAHPGEDPRALVRSLRGTAARKPKRMFCAHRGFVENPADALTEKADWTESLIVEIDRRISEGWSDAEIRAKVLGGESASGWFSRGDYSRGNFVRALRRTHGAAG